MKLAAPLLLVSILILAGCSSSTSPSDHEPYPDIDGIVAYYSFEGHFENEVSDAHHGTASSRAVTFVDGPHYDPDAGPIGQAIHVEKLDYVLIPDDPALDFTNALSIAAWVNPEASDQALAALVFKHEDDAYCLGMWGGIADPESTDIQVHLTDRRVFTDRFVPMGTDTWSHIAFTYDGASGRVRIYFNSTKVDSGIIAAPIGVSDDDLYIGYGPGAGGYKGKIDKVAIFGRALTSSEITDLYMFEE